MKFRLLWIMLLALSIVALTACGNTKDESKSEPANTQAIEEQNTTTEDTTTSVEEESAIEKESKVVEEEPADTETSLSFYFTANEGGSISKVDASTNQVVDTIKLEGSVHNVQISPDGKMLGVTMVPAMSNHGDMVMTGTAYFYDAETNELIKEVEVGNHPAHIVFTHDGKYALVTNNEGNSVSVIDLNTYQVTSTIPTGNGPHGFRISQDNKYAFVANMSEDTVSVLDLTNFKEEEKVKVGKTPVTTAINSDRSKLYVPLNAENALAVVDLATKSVEKIPVGTGPAQVYLQADDQYVFVANQGTKKNPSNTLSKIDTKTNQVVATIETGAGAHGIVTSDDLRFVYVTNMFENTVSVIDNASNLVVATVSVDIEPNGITFKK